MMRWLAVLPLLAASRWAGAEPIPFKQDAGAAAAALPGGAIGMLLLSVLAIVAVLVVRKRLNLQAGGAAARHLQVLQTQRLGPRTLLAVVEFGGQQHLIAQSEHGVSCLATVACPAPASPPEVA